MFTMCLSETDCSSFSPDGVDSEDLCYQLVVCSLTDFLLCVSIIMYGESHKFNIRILVGTLPIQVEVFSKKYVTVILELYLCIV